MKKIVLSLISLSSSSIAFAQVAKPLPPIAPQLPSHPDMDHELLQSSFPAELIPLFVIGLLVLLIIKVTKYTLDTRLKNKIIDRGISEQLASSILEKSEGDKKEESIKWAFLLLGLSGGLTAAYYTKPLDIHSIAIMTFSLGLGYLAYYYFLNSKRN